jgi:signal transduction histidine kinase
MDLSAVLSLLIGLLQVLLAVVAVRELGRYARAFPWLVALSLFFVLRGSMRIYAAFAGSVPETLAVGVDVLLLVVLALLIVGLDQTVRGLRLAENEALYREEEYARALADYRRLARHRLATPLTVLRSGTTALRSLDLDPRQRDEVLDALEDASRKLEQVALEPEPMSPEERGLEPRPARRRHASKRSTGNAERESGKPEPRQIRR